MAVVDHPSVDPSLQQCSVAWLRLEKEDYEIICLLQSPNREIRVVLFQAMYPTRAHRKYEIDADSLILIMYSGAEEHVVSVQADVGATEKRNW